VIARRAGVVAVALGLAGCVHYPTVADVGGTMLRTANGRAVRQDDRTLVSFDVISTGKFGDVITALSTPVARQAQLVDAAGSPLARVEVPGTTTMKFTADGPHAVLTELQRPLAPGETFILTLVFEKSGGIGVVTRVE
jgi:copper(I)-binding protein